MMVMGTEIWLLLLLLLLLFSWTSPSMRSQVGCDRVLYLSGGGDSRRLELGLPDLCNRDNN